MKIIKKGDKAQSQIVGTVLLILLVIVAAMIIMGFVIPFINKQLSSTGCLDVVDGIQIKNNLDYTCYDSTVPNLRVQIHMGDIVNLTKGFQLSVESGGSSDVFEISDNSDTDVSMYDETEVEVPGKNEERTYVIDGIDSLPESISVYPILNNGDTCDPYTLNVINECES